MKTLTTQFYLVALVFLIVIALCIPAVPEETKAQLRPWLYPLLIMINQKQGTGADIFPAQKIDIPKEVTATVKSLVLVFLFCLFTLPLAGCGSMNEGSGAVLNYAAQNYAGAKQNVQSADDMRLVAWSDQACAMNVGALARNATGNPNIVKAVLEACPVPSVGVISMGAGSINIQTVAVPAVLTKPYGVTGP